MTKKNKNKPVHDVILERAQSINWDNVDDRFAFHPGMTLEEIQAKTEAMFEIAKQSKGK